MDFIYLLKSFNFFRLLNNLYLKMLAPVGLQHASQSGLTPSQSSGTAGSALGAPIFGQSAKLASPPQISPLLGSSLGTNSLGPVNPSPLVANSINSTSFASLAHSSSTVGGASVNVGELPLVKTDTKLINNVAAGSLKGVVPDASMKPTDIDTLKKKLAMMERETQRLREMHKLRLKKLETKQRAQEERSKRDAEIQRVSQFKIQRNAPKTPFANYRNHIADLLYRNIVSYLS